MKSNIQYNKKTAYFHNIEYYENIHYFIKNKELLDKQIEKFKITNKNDVSNLSRKEINSLDDEKVFKILQNIYEKNTKYIFHGGEKPINSNLLGLVSEVPLLIVSYELVRKNSGSMIQVYPASEQSYEKLDTEQKSFFNNTDQGPYGVNYQLFQEVSRLIRKGKYPWGTNRSIYTGKPGKMGAKRYLTIPPFMDKVVQTAIKTVLVAIYEPYFDKMNVSFGFRPGKSIQDAISLITGQKSSGLTMALEGDIKLGYNKVNRDKLVKILGKKIKDRKFLNLIKGRLELEYYYTEKKMSIKEELGIPQVEVDVLYLWNIYMLEFDEFIRNNINEKINIINLKSQGKKSENKEFITNQRKQLEYKRLIIKQILNFIRRIKNEKGSYFNELKKLNKKPEGKWKNEFAEFKGVIGGGKYLLKILNLVEEMDEKSLVRKLQKYLRRINHIINNISYLNENKIKFRMLYARFSHRWILLTNLKRYMLEEIKIMISTFLQEELYITLSEKKTSIADIKENPVHFLGFEIRSYKSRKIGKYTQNNRGKHIKVKINTVGSKVFAGIDKQRVFNIMYKKGYCDKNGKPREISKLVNLNTFIIIEKYNSVLIGLSNFYSNFIKNPKTDLSRWIYILRYSCLKTLAQKHKLSLRQVFKKFIPKEKKANMENTIEALVQIKIGNETWTKSWALHTNKSLIDNSKSWNIFSCKKSIEQIHKELSEGKPPTYEQKKYSMRMNSDDYLERIKWFNIRITSYFHMPCCICGSFQEIEMIHIKHVRKNRKQIPVCRLCYMNVIYKENYDEKSLATFVHAFLHDNRIIVTESSIHKNDAEQNYKKALQEKGWIKDK